MTSNHKRVDVLHRVHAYDIAFASLTERELVIYVIFLQRVRDINVWQQRVMVVHANERLSRFPASIIPRVHATQFMRRAWTYQTTAIHRVRTTQGGVHDDVYIINTTCGILFF